ncbi:MAG: phosphoribosylaminoimidazolesuccinocarboxamide synthase [candidate division WOR-3 bacterium]
MTQPVSSVELPGLPRVAQGKVRDIFQVGPELLVVCSDRLSAFDVVLPDPIPDKGKVLNLLSAFWFDQFRDVIPNHVITTDVEQFPTELAPYRDVLDGRAMLVKRARPLPVECVVRGYLAGSAWVEYQQKGSVCGIELPRGLEQSQQLPSPIFTPSTKAQSGHDVNITEQEMGDLIGYAEKQWVKSVSLELYRRGAEYALERGIIIADTKFEFGLYRGEMMLIDEVLTPDSSRFWDVETYQVGTSPPSFDKQFVRDYLQALGWNKTPPGPHLPGEVIAGTSARYREAYRRITGSSLE